MLHNFKLVSFTVFGQSRTGVRQALSQRQQALLKSFCDTIRMQIVHAECNHWLEHQRFLDTVLVDTIADTKEDCLALCEAHASCNALTYEGSCHLMNLPSTTLGTRSLDDWSIRVRSTWQLLSCLMPQQMLHSSR
jgi:hypothetical protein